MLTENFAKSKKLLNSAKIGRVLDGMKYGPGPNRVNIPAPGQAVSRAVTMDSTHPVYLCDSVLNELTDGRTDERVNG